MNITMGLWRPLVNPAALHTDDVRNLSDLHQNPTKEPEEGEKPIDRIDIVKPAIEGNSQTLLIINALDELPERVCTKLLKRLRYLQISRTCNILVTARPYHYITKLLEDDPRFEISAQWNDLNLYIKAKTYDGVFDKLRAKLPMLEDNIARSSDSQM